MKSRYIVLSAAVAVVAGALVLTQPGHTAERVDNEQPALDAVMRIDIAPLLRRLDTRYAEVVRSSEALEQQVEVVKALQEKLDSLEKAIESISRPEKWQYHFLWEISKTAADNLGEQGWELVAVGFNPKGNNNYLVFRKPADDTADREGRP